MVGLRIRVWINTVYFEINFTAYHISCRDNLSLASELKAKGASKSNMEYNMLIYDGVVTVNSNTHRQNHYLIFLYNLICSMAVQYQIWLRRVRSWSLYMGQMWKGHRILDYNVHIKTEKKKYVVKLRETAEDRRYLSSINFYTHFVKNRQQSVAQFLVSPSPVCAAFVVAESPREN